MIQQKKVLAIIPLQLEEFFKMTVWIFILFYLNLFNMGLGPQSYSSSPHTHSEQYLICFSGKAEREVEQWRRTASAL